MLISVAVLGLVAALDPLRPVLFVLVLRTQLVNAIAFLAGWTLALSLLFVIVFATFAADIPTGRQHQRAASAAELAIGLMLLVIAASRWHRRHDERTGGGYPRAVQRRLDSLDARRAAVIGVLIQPRSLTAAAAVVIARDRSGTLSALIGFAVFAVVSTAALLGILSYDVWRPERARLRMTGVVSALERRGPMIFTVLCGVGGFALVVDGLRALVS